MKNLSIKFSLVLVFSLAMQFANANDHFYKVCLNNIEKRTNKNMFYKAHGYQPHRWSNEINGNPNNSAEQCTNSTLAYSGRINAVIDVSVKDSTNPMVATYRPRRFSLNIDYQFKDKNEKEGEQIWIKINNLKTQMKYTTFGWAIKDYDFYPYFSCIYKITYDYQIASNVQNNSGIQRRFAWFKKGCEKAGEMFIGDGGNVFHKCFKKHANCTWQSSLPMPGEELEQDSN